MQERNLSIRGFARDAKLNHVTVSRIVHNQTKGVTLEMIARITGYLNIEPGELFEAVKVKNK